MNSFSLAHLFEVVWWCRWTLMGIYVPPSHLLSLPSLYAIYHLLIHVPHCLCHTALEGFTFFCMLLIICTWQNFLLYFKVKQGGCTGKFYPIQEFFWKLVSTDKVHISYPVKSKQHDSTIQEY